MQVSGGRGTDSAALKCAMTAWTVSRLSLVVITGIAAAIRHLSPIQIWNQLDASWYIGIAEHGYHWTLDGKPALAFFPLYPLLIHAATLTGLPAIVCGLVLSNAAFAGALLYVYLLGTRFGSGASHWAVWLLALLPTAFFTFAPYTEALFLLCSAGALYHAQRGDVAVASLWLAAACLTRSTGLILVVPVLMLLRDAPSRSWLWALFPTMCGWGTFLASLHLQGVDATGILHAQRAWHRAITYPWTGFTASLDWLVHRASANLPWAVENVLQLSVALLFLVLTARLWPRLDPAIRVYAVGFWALILTTPEWLDTFYAPFSSLDRFVLALFPLAFYMKIPRGVLHWRLMVVSGVLMLGATSWHLAGGWVG